MRKKSSLTAVLTYVAIPLLLLVLALAFWH
jgi:hypothetical protein